MKPTTVEFKLEVRCDADASFKVLDILKDMNIEYKLIDKAAFAPVADQILYSFLVSLATGTSIKIFTALVKRLADDNIHVEYETRYELARTYLKDRQPLLPITRLDREEFSEYLFKTRDSRFKWTYDRGTINCAPAK